MRKTGITFVALTSALVALFTATTSAEGAQRPAHRPDCSLVAKADRSLCGRVQRQHAYGAFLSTDPRTEVSGWSAPNGRALVHEITHQGLTKTEMHSYLTGEAATYREWVTAVPVNMDAIVRKCGNTDGEWIVRFQDEDGKPGGRKQTRRFIRCA